MHLGILDALIIAFYLLSLVVAQHAIATLYSLLFIEAYCSFVGLKKPLITTLVDFLRPRHTD